MGDRVLPARVDPAGHPRPETPGARSGEAVEQYGPKVEPQDSAPSCKESAGGTGRHRAGVNGTPARNRKRRGRSVLSGRSDSRPLALMARLLALD